MVHGFVLSDELSIGSMMLSEARTKCGREELVSMEALLLSELLAYGGVSPATSRDGEGQVDAEVTRAALMGRYPYTCRASLSRGPSDVVRFCLLGRRPVNVYVITRSLWVLVVFGLGLGLCNWAKTLFSIN